MNADGDLELLIQSSDGTVLCYSALSASLLWSRQLPRPSFTLDMRLVDIDNDLHIFIATDAGSVSHCHRYRYWVSVLTVSSPLTLGQSLDTVIATDDTGSES